MHVMTGMFVELGCRVVVHTADVTWSHVSIPHVTCPCVPMPHIHAWPGLTPRGTISTRTQLWMAVPSKAPAKVLAMLTPTAKPAGQECKESNGHDP